MKRFTICAFMVSCHMGMMAQNNLEGESIEETAIVLLILVLSVIMVVHMLYELFIRKNPFSPISLQEMKALREAEGLPAMMSQNEINQCCKMMEDEFNLWTPIPGDANGARLFTTKKEMNHAIETFNQIKALKPTDQGIVDGVNGYMSLAMEGRKREFTGSKVLLVILAILCGIIIFVGGKEGGMQVAAFFVLMGGIYYMASLTPVFIIFDREVNNSNSIGCMGALFAGLGGMILGAQSVKTTTKWSDGTTTTDTDHSAHGVAWYIALVVTLFVLCTLLIWSFFNYLRNYVFYY